MADKLSGTLILLRSLGLGPVIEAAQKIAESGSLEKILQFADDVPAIKESLARIERQLMEMENARREFETRSNRGLGQLENTWPNGLQPSRPNGSD
jgi:hypothetical protein